MTKLWLYLGSSTFDAADARALNAGGALLLDGACRRAPNLSGYFIGRSMLDFPDNVPFGTTEADAYQNGKVRALEMFNRYPMKLSARMGPNEPGIRTIEGARLQGAFEAGTGDVCWRMGEDYVGSTWAYGNPELDGDPTHAALVVEWLRTYRKWSPRSKLIIGYHGYRRSRDDAQALADATWFERRPFDWWKPAILAAGLDMPDVIMTESGYDAGVVESNGYRDRLGSERYARYLAALPLLVPEATAFCIFGYRITQDWIDRGFDYADDAVVLAAIADVNTAATPPEETPMPVAWDRAREWADYQKRLSVAPAFEKYRAAHPELGDWIDEAEYDDDPYRLRGAAGGLVWARIGDWGNVRHATYLGQLPLA